MRIEGSNVHSKLCTIENEAILAEWPKVRKVKKFTLRLFETLCFKDMQHSFGKIVF